MNKKIIFLDCDGTIFDVPRGMPKPSYKTEYAIKELIKNGHYVYISTGRSLGLVPDMVKDLHPTGFVTNNGGYCCNENEVVYSHDIYDESLDAVKKFCKEHNGVYCFEKQDKIYVEDTKNPLYVRFAKCWEIDNGVFTDDKKYSEGPYQLMMAIFNDEKTCDEFEETLKDKVDIRKQYGFTSFDVSDFGYDKGYGVKKTLEYYGMKKEDAYAFGDGLNDLEMLQEVQNSYCMSNGNPKLKAIAKYIAPDCLNEGFYKTMVKEKLIKPID